MNKKNKKGITHGYWEYKYLNGKARCKFTLNNGMLIGYAEWYYENSNIYCKQIRI